jgi:hypothetical protein
LLAQEAAYDAPLPRRCTVLAASGAACPDAARCGYSAAAPPAALAAPARFGCALPAASRAAAPPEEDIPNIVHWVHPGAPGEPFPFWQYLHICAALDVLSPDALLFHHAPGALPAGRWWAATAPLVTLAPARAVASVYGNEVSVRAHASDVTRLAALLAHGGAYLDADVLPLRAFAPLRRSAGVVLGVQSEGRTANAVILARRGAPFLRRWADGYHDFTDADWDAFSVRLPAALAQRHPTEVSWLPRGAWYDPGPDDTPGEAFFGRNMSDDAFAAQPQRYAAHLWHHLTAAHLDAVEGPAWFAGPHRHTLYARLVRQLAASGRCPRVAAALALPQRATER